MRLQRVKNNWPSILITSLIMLLPMVVGMILWDKLPDQIATHFNASGLADGYSSKKFTVFGMNAILFGLQVLGIVLMCLDRRSKMSDKLFGMMLYVVPVITLGVYYLIYSKALGSDINVLLAAFLLVGIVFMVLGNYMSKIRQNWLIGFRFKATLESKQNWEATNRFGGRVMFFLGVLLIVLGFLSAVVEGIVLAILFVVLTLAAIILVISYSHRYRKNHKNDPGYFNKEK